MHLVVAKAPHPRVYILNNTSKVFNKTVAISLADSKDKVIKIPSRTYTTLDIKSDSIKLLIDGTTQAIGLLNDKPYYLVITSDVSSAFVLNEIPEYIFWLTVNINQAKNSGQYFLP